MGLIAVGAAIGIVEIDGPRSSLTQRIICGALGSLCLLIGTTSALARLAQIFALWAGRATDSAKDNASRYRRIAVANAGTASSAAWLARVTAAAASFLAAFYAWSSSGGVVSGRAHKAGSEATSRAAGAWAQIRKSRSGL